MEVELEDGDGNVDEKFVRGGAVGEDGSGIRLKLHLGEKICRVLHLEKGPR